MTKFELVARIERTIGPSTGLWRASKDTLERINAQFDALSEYRTFGYDPEIDRDPALGCLSCGRTDESLCEHDYCSGCSIHADDCQGECV